jgi:hypothetical protein
MRKRISGRKTTYDFAISYAEEQIDFADALYRFLHAPPYCYRVFFDRRKRKYLLGKNMEEVFDYVFAKGTKFVVPIISADYKKSQWCRYELRIAQKEAKKRPYDDFIVPLKVDDTDIVDLPHTVNYLDISKMSPKKVGKILVGKMRRRVPDRGKMPSKQVSKALVGKTRIRFPHRNRQDHIEVLVVTFGLVFDDFIRRDDVPPDVPQGYAQACDWLEQTLLSDLYNSGCKGCFFPEPSSRDGECLSVRVAFPAPDQQPLEFSHLKWWEVLEVKDWRNIYDSKPPRTNRLVKALLARSKHIERALVSLLEDARKPTISKLLDDVVAQTECTRKAAATVLKQLKARNQLTYKMFQATAYVWLTDERGR